MRKQQLVVHLIFKLDNHEKNKKGVRNVSVLIQSRKGKREVFKHIFVKTATSISVIPIEPGRALSNNLSLNMFSINKP